MRLSSGKRIGQSRQELATAVSFSLFLHVIFSCAAVLLYFTVTPRVHVPPFYAVKLVSLPSDPFAVPQNPAGQPLPPVPVPEKHTAKQQPRAHVKKSAERRHPAEKKAGLPDLAAASRKPAVTEEEPAEKPQPAAAAQPSQQAAPASANAQGVAVSAGQQDFKYGWYLESVRNKISQHWNPPPDARDARARVIFSINRSGWLGEVTLEADQSNATFQFKQAAIRAIRASSPFPQLPDGFSKQTLEFTVDLTALE